MADTERTLAYLLASVFQDGQAAGAITPQDIRDLIVSVSPAHAAYYWSTPAATTITTANTFYKVAGTTTSMHGAGGGFTHTDNKLVYTGATEQGFMVHGSFSFACNTNNQTLEFRLAKNGTPVAASSITLTIGTGTDRRVASIAWYGELATTDYLELFVTNQTSSGTTVTVQSGTITALRVFE